LWQHATHLKVLVAAYAASLRKHLQASAYQSPIDVVHMLLALRCAVVQEYEDAAEDEYVSEYEDTDGDEDDGEGPALPLLHLEQALGEAALQLLCTPSES
jgi:hypothetical protein